MKKITYISLLFFFTSIFYLFMWFFGFQSVWASFFSDIVLTDWMDVSYSSYCSGNTSAPVFSSDWKKIFLSCDNSMKVFSVSSPYTLEWFTYLSSTSIGFTFKQFYFIDSRNLVWILFNWNYPDNFPLRKIFLSNPYDFSSFSITNYPFNASYFQFNKNWKLLYLQERWTYNSDLVISQYSLFNPYDLSTAFLDYKKTISAGGSVLWFSFSSDWNELSYYLYDTSNPRFCYRSLSNSYDLNTINNDLICKPNWTFWAYFLNSLSSDYSYIISSMRYATSPNNRNMRILYTWQSFTGNFLKYQICEDKLFNYEYPQYFFKSSYFSYDSNVDYNIGHWYVEYTNSYEFWNSFITVENLDLQWEWTQWDNFYNLFSSWGLNLKTFGRLSNPIQYRNNSWIWLNSHNDSEIQYINITATGTVDFYYIVDQNWNRLFPDENNWYWRTFEFNKFHKLKWYGITSLTVVLPSSNLKNSYTITDIEFWDYQVQFFEEEEYCKIYTPVDDSHITYDDENDKYLYDDGDISWEVIFDENKQKFVVVDKNGNIIKELDTDKKLTIDGDEVTQDFVNEIDWQATIDREENKAVSDVENNDLTSNTIFRSIFWKFTWFLNDVFWLFIITLPRTPDMNVVVPVPFITPDFKIWILYKPAVLSVIEDNLWVSQINTDDNSWRYFLVFFLSILYILIRVFIIWFTLFLFWMYWYIVKLFLSYVIGFSIQESIIWHPSNGMWLVVYVLVYWVVLTFFIWVFHYSIWLNDFLLSVTSWLNLFFTFISANIWMYNTLANIVNFFFAWVVVSLVGFLTLKHVIGFWRLN